eukprot:Rhum_TRINITY_DN13580_c0_g1::Rhum_TRINITY_DN13580_c0_g1_i4::g.61493::m.61493
MPTDQEWIEEKLAALHPGWRQRLATLGHQRELLRGVARGSAKEQRRRRAAGEERFIAGVPTHGADTITRDALSAALGVPLGLAAVPAHPQPHSRPCLPCADDPAAAAPLAPSVDGCTVPLSLFYRRCADFVAKQGLPPPAAEAADAAVTAAALLQPPPPPPPPPVVAHARSVCVRHPPVHVDGALCSSGGAAAARGAEGSDGGGVGWPSALAFRHARPFCASYTSQHSHQAALERQMRAGARMERTRQAGALRRKRGSPACLRLVEADILLAEASAAPGVSGGGTAAGRSLSPRQLERSRRHRARPSSSGALQVATTRAIRQRLRERRAEAGGRRCGSACPQVLRDSCGGLTTVT